jgi:hypothetical protein
MNNHIEKLLDKALDRAVPETWTRLTHEQTMRLSSTLAELIVQDNIQTLRSNGYDDAAQVLQDIHFGIEDPV